MNRGGAVVLTTSVANVKGLPGQATYGAAKAALAAIIRTDARRRVASSGNSRQRGHARSHRHDLHDRGRDSGRIMGRTNSSGGRKGSWTQRHRAILDDKECAGDG